MVEKYPQSSAYPEALFYLADSLYLKRDYLSSRRFFEKIVEVGPANRRYQESLQRLIELSLHTGDYSPVDGYIAKLEGLAVDKQLPSVPYVKGKYFFFRQQYDKALEALKDIGFEVEKGEVLSLVGPNGCGKSTLLQIVSGILQPTTGRVVTRGRIAALLELKSTLMRNGDEEELDGLEPEQAAEELLARMLEARRYRSASEHLRELLARERGVHFRAAPLPAPAPAGSAVGAAEAKSDARRRV